MKRFFKTLIAMLEVIAEESLKRNETPMEEIDRTAGVAFMWN